MADVDATNKPQTAAPSASQPRGEDPARAIEPQRRGNLLRSDSLFSFMRRFMSEIVQLFDDIRLGPP